MTVCMPLIFNITMDKIQGSTISFNFDIAQTRFVANFNEVEKMVLYFYTNTSFISKHTIESKEGYHEITIDGTVASGTIPSEDTKKMLGALRMEILIVDTKKQERLAYSTPTGINIVYKPITEET